MRWIQMVTVVVLGLLALAPGVEGKHKRSCDGGACTTRSEMRYAVIAHPDDEFQGGWALIQDRPATYTVFVIATQGENTRSCIPAGESRPGGDPGLANGVFVEGITGEGFAGLGLEGPYRYQGPDSPVGEPDKGERHPFGNPWQGKGTLACRLARMASWHWFLDDMAADDASLPDMRIDRHPMRDDDYVGRRCAAGLCAHVWANRDGARVAFDLGDGNLTAGEVRQAVATLRRSRHRWKLPSLREAGVIAASYHYEGGTPGCTFDDHPDHAAVQEALFVDSGDAGPHFGSTCAVDDRHLAHPGPPALIDPVTLVRTNLVDPVTEQRIGPFTVNYGWLWDTYSMVGSPVDRFWQR